LSARLLLLLAALWSLCGCRRAAAPALATPAGAQGAMRYATGFSLIEKEGWTRVQVRKPWQGAKTDFTYALIRSGEDPRDIPPEAVRVTVPAKRVITMTTVNLPVLRNLGALDALVGLGGARYVCDEAVRQRLQAGRIREVGDDMRVDVEAALDLHPDLIFTFAVGGAANEGVRKLQEAGLPAAMEGSYMEETPLGRAEWIKFTAAFFGKGARADSAFDTVEKAYDSLAALARGARTRPTVLTNAPFGGSWWIPGGRSYVARFLADAGAQYLWESDTTRGALSLDLEAVLARAGEADFWLNPGDWRSLKEGRERDPRMALFKAFREGRVYNNDAKRCEGGGNEFFETSPTRPDLLLADLIAIFHPELVPDHKPVWYRRLEEKP
jgi:iron complex transport system substrate-binding protein